MEIAISIFVGLWICAAAIFADIRFKKDFGNSEDSDK